MSVVLSPPLAVGLSSDRAALPFTETVLDGAVRVSESVGARGENGPMATLDIVEEWGLHSFPASDPPANW